MKQLGTDQIKWPSGVCTYQSGSGCVVSAKLTPKFMIEISCSDYLHSHKPTFISTQGNPLAGIEYTCCKV